MCVHCLQKPGWDGYKMNVGMKTQAKARNSRLLGTLLEGGLSSRRTMGSHYRSEVQGEDFLIETRQKSIYWA